MAERRGPAVYTIPAHRAFADALAAGLIERTAGDRMALARAIVLLPSNRAARALTEAFVRRSGGGGLLLPRLVAVGDLDLGERVGLALDIADMDLPPAIEGCARTLILARLVRRMRERTGDPVTMGEAVRLAEQLGRTLDQLLIDEVDASRLADLVPAELAHHWSETLALLRIVVEAWPALLAERGLIDAADRRNRLFDGLARTWRTAPPDGMVIAAGIANASPALARLLRTVAGLADGMVVLPALDTQMPDDEWAALDACDTHPQCALKGLLDALGVARGEVMGWRRAGGMDGPPARARAVERAMAPAAFTGRWQQMRPRDRRLTGVRFVEAPTPAAEAQAIALALRGALDTPGRTAALVTPDRGLARRVAAHLGRWGIAIDDSAGRPLSRTPPGAFLAALAQAAAEGFAPVALLALLKHPLADPDDDRLTWLGDVRALDKALRGPRPGPGLDGIARRVRHPHDSRWLDADERDRLPGWWAGVAALLAPLAAAMRDEAPLRDLLAALVEVAEGLGRETLWAGPAGQAASALIDDLSRHADEVGALDPTELPGLLAAFMDGVAVRPPYGGHPRLAIYGLIEARLQRADLMILAGLNEGTWPALPAPDPWLAPRLRVELGIGGLERRIGLAAHDLVLAMGAPEVLVTRARRDMSAPTVASRFWLRLQAMTGGVPRQAELAAWAAAVDRPETVTPARRPSPAPAASLRPRRISVTAVDRLLADPFAFYAQAMLGLRKPDPVDADPSAAERGNAVHDILEHWLKEDGGDPALLAARAERMIAGWSEHPLLRVLWGPRVRRASEWAAERLANDRVAGWRPVGLESAGEAELAGILLHGRADRIDANGGELGIIDYKTGSAPSHRQLLAGFALQLGLLGWLARAGAFDGVAGEPTRFEYWLLKGGASKAGEVKDPRRLRDKLPPELEDLASFAAARFGEAARRYLTGDEPFVARLHPEYAPWSDYDQLARVDEWLGRGRG